MSDFLAAYAALPPVEWQDRLRIENVTRTVMAQFYARLERELQLGLANAYDVAVSDFDYDPKVCGVTAQIVPHAPGAPLPQGRRWTIYKCSRGLP